MDRWRLLLTIKIPIGFNINRHMLEISFCSLKNHILSSLKMTWHVRNIHMHQLSQSIYNRWQKLKIFKRLDLDFFEANSFLGQIVQILSHFFQCRSSLRGNPWVFFLSFSYCICAKLGLCPKNQNGPSIFRESCVIFRSTVLFYLIINVKKLGGCFSPI